jgi:hypothetical protein
MTNDSDIQEPIWEAVAELELEHYTKREIAEALRDVSDTVNPDDGVMGQTDD